MTEPKDPTDYRVRPRFTQPYSMASKSFANTVESLTASAVKLAKAGITTDPMALADLVEVRTHAEHKADYVGDPGKPIVTFREDIYGGLMVKSTGAILSGLMWSRDG